NPMMYTNLIWTWGHPEVYVLILPVFGIYSEIVATFSQKRLFSYTSLVVGAIGITMFSMLVWLHHFFTMGSGADVNAFFGIMTVIIALPTAAQIFAWISTMFRGKIILSNPMLWFLGFVATFTFGGLAGVLMAIPPADFQIHNSLFLVAHFHTQVVGGALFGIFGGLIYWFPKITGFKLNERIGKWAFWFWIIGFLTSFTPLYILGLMGAPRRLDHYTNPAWQPFFITSAIGVVIIGIGVMLQVLQIIVSIRNRKKNIDSTGDPWNGRTLEWATSSPAPFYNFAVIPQVTDKDAFWEMKKRKNKEPEYEDIVLPKNTALGIYVAGFALLAGFAMVWHIFWLAIAATIGAIVCVVIRTFDEETEYILPASEVAKLERERKKAYA
ncbi:MAG: cbb3-type cytochrome c oxidase subunit I, partial [Patescibacteria group bacterium]|nr:cbb3-type cytochrome c oxidase subunit I [Patescibacteria group bacterium]